MNQQNKVALITGASGGIGKAYAEQLAKRKYNLILSGRQKEVLDDIAGKLSADYSIDADYVVSDLSTQDGIKKLTDRINDEGGVDMLVSNAGYAERSRFNDKDVEEINKMLSVHINATVQLVHAVLPGMINKKCGNIISVSSLSAYVPAPGSSIYSSSKLFLNSFMEAIHMEVRKMGIKVQSLCPGLTHTGFHQGTSVAQSAEVRGMSIWMQPEDVVQASLRKLGKRSVIYTPGSINKVLRALLPLLPRKPYYAIAGRFATRFK